jgi:hypothetical protein
MAGSERAQFRLRAIRMPLRAIRILDEEKVLENELGATRNMSGRCDIALRLISGKSSSDKNVSPENIYSEKRKHKIGGKEVIIIRP